MSGEIEILVTILSYSTTKTLSFFDNCACGLLLIWIGKKMLAAVSEITNKLKAKTFPTVAPIAVSHEQLFPDRNPFLRFLSSVLAPIVVSRSHSLFPDRTCTNSGTTSNVSVRDA